MKKLISVVIPGYNEEENIIPSFEKIRSVFASELPAYDYELIFVDDGSTDNSENILEKLGRENQNFKYLIFSRNFGKEAATTAGLKVAGGDAVLMIDADLQHPIELIPEFVKKWEAGAEVVIGVRNKSKSDSWVKKIGSNVFYRIMTIISDTKITPRATDFRLLDKKVVLSFRRFTEHGRMTRGLIDWLGFKREYINFDANSRLHGRASYNKIKLAKLAFSSFITYSLFPLKLVGYLGSIITLLAGAFGFFTILGKYVFHNRFFSSFTGSAQLAILIVFLVGMMMAGLGLVSLYIANIKIEVANRPNYINRKSNF